MRAGWGPRLGTCRGLRWRGRCSREVPARHRDVSVRLGLVWAALPGAGSRGLGDGYLESPLLSREGGTEGAVPLGDNGSRGLGDGDLESPLLSREGGTEGAVRQRRMMEIFFGTVSPSTGFGGQWHSDAMVEGDIV